MNNLLVAHDLVKHYNNRAVVNGVHLIVAPSEVVAVIGPNGAGKSTMLEMILGLRRPDSGEIVFWCKQPNRYIGVQLQTTPFFRGLTVAENLMLFANFYGVHLTRQQVDDTLVRCGLVGTAWLYYSIANACCSHLSLGPRCYTNCPSITYACCVVEQERRVWQALSLAIEPAKLAVLVVLPKPIDKRVGLRYTSNVTRTLW